MKKFSTALALAILMGMPHVAAAASNASLVEFEMMTWPEVKAAMATGKTTALFYTGGTEQKGPQNVNGGHTLVARATVRLIAERLGNAIAMPVLPFTPNEASADLPGTIGLTNDILAVVLERVAEQALVTGFKNVILMGDHGGGQPAVYKTVAEKLNAKYAPRGAHVYYCDDVYEKSKAEFDSYLIARGIPAGGHGAVTDTSEMLNLGGEAWVRKELIATALGDPAPGSGRDPKVARVNNGITGDGRKANADLGRVWTEMKVNDAVKQIQGFIGSAPK